MDRNIQLAYIVGTLRNAWFWLGIWVLFYLSITDYRGIGIVESVLFFTAIILEVPTGAIADILGKKVTLVSSFILSGICNFALAYSTNLTQLVVAVIFGGIAISLYSGAFDSLVYDSLLFSKNESKFNSVISKISSYQLIMMAVCSIIGGFIFTIDPKLPFLLCGLFAFVAAGVSLLFSEPPLDTVKFSFNNYINQNIVGFKHLFNQNLLRYVFFLVIISSVYALSDEMLDSILGYEFGLNSQALGILYSVISIVAALFSYLSSRLSPKVDIFWLILVISGASALTYMLSPFVGIVLGSFLLIFRTALMTVHSNFQSSLLNQHISSKYRATTLSSFNLIKTLPYALSVPFLGIYMQQITARTFALYVGIVIALVIVIQSLRQKTA